MMKWFIGIAAVLGLFAYALVQNEAILRWQLARVVAQEGVTTGDDFLRQKFNPDTRAFVDRYSDGLAWRRRLCAVGLVMSDYAFVLEASEPAIEAQKEGPLANGEDMQMLVWQHAQCLELYGKITEAKAALKAMIEQYPQHPEIETARQHLAGLDLYH